ncbi:glycoside hydrolase family 99-like domain-containing protein [Terriglobus roseus]|uniref:Glycosyltransferase WbsX n=1 Tax=Terriglobus roseus TaxID=392734 RepID=A0A1G7H722_9BACT|nr:glycoside hydrolase family 99-like domain-containing protein [Terriglobus roseus]SDE96171.1 Glycosyltransferase WbsX [Terriglobus roseus]
MHRREFIARAGATLLHGGLIGSQAAIKPPKADACITAAYYFGNFHVDPRNEEAHGKGWTEWNLVKAATPRFAGHHQPKVPQWGYADEATPEAFRQKIDAASQHGVDALIFDWYWYEDGPFLNGALGKGYLMAPNNRDVRFALMWANHDWIDLHPAKLDSPGKVQFHGGISRKAFDTMCERVVQLFQHPSYLKLDGEPYFSIYELFRFIEGMGGVSQAALALDALRQKARAAGFPGVHINAVTWGVKLLPGETEVQNLPQLLKQLRIDSTTSYVWIHHAQLSQEFQTEYEDVRRQYEKYRDKASDDLGCMYFPNVTVGWDASPRTCQTDNFRVSGYPFTSVVVNNSPQAFADALRSAKKFAVEHLPAGKRLVTLNSWNEWTEGSYLEPDMDHGTAYLDAVHEVFGSS